MFKAISTVALVQLSAASINKDFISGLETGVHITDYHLFSEYSCPEPEMSNKIESALGMYKMAESMMVPKPSKKKSLKDGDEDDNSSMQLIEKLDKYAEQIAVVASVMDKEYTGGDFCQGLTIGYEGRSVVQSAAMGFIKGIF